VWNLRKCSAAALDMLSNHLSDEHVLPLLLPIVQQRLADQDWKVGGVHLIMQLLSAVPLDAVATGGFGTAGWTEGFTATDSCCWLCCAVLCCAVLCRFVRVPSLPLVL
jgi:hypothetical protein